MVKAFPFTVNQAATLEAQLYEIETAGLAMAEVFASKIDPEYQLCVASALNKAILATFADCMTVLSESHLLASAGNEADQQHVGCPAA